MPKFYSFATRGFYDDAIHDEIPSDAAPVTEAQHEALLLALSSGFVIASDAEGNPIAVQAPANPNATIIAEISAIEAATAVPRVLREFLLVSMEDLAQRKADQLTAAGHPATKEQVLENNVGYKKTRAVNDQIEALRVKLT